MSQNRLALDIGVSPRRINEIVLEKRRITADTAPRLARYFNASPQFWLGLQADYDVDVASLSLGDRLEREVKARAAAGHRQPHLTPCVQCGRIAMRPYGYGYPFVGIYPTCWND